MAANQVSHYNCFQSGAPTWNGTAGSSIAVADACLVNGWGSQTATSLVVAGTVATLTLPSTPAMIPQGLVTVAGATLTGFVNGDYKVQTVAGNVVTFNVSGVTAGTATGTITAKVTPLGWTKVFSATNAAVYRSSNVAGSQRYLQIDDTGTQTARVTGWETMSAYATGTNTFPSATQQSGGLYMAKSNSADSVAKQWRLIGDDRAVYFLPMPSNTVSLSVNANGAATTFFGDIIPLNSLDTAYSCALMSSNSSTIYSSASDVADLAFVAAPTTTISSFPVGHFMCRPYTQVGTSSLWLKYPKGFAPNSSTQSGATGQILPWPNSANNGLILCRYGVWELTTYRGDLPGAFYVANNLSTAQPFVNGDMIAGSGSLAGRMLMYSKAGGAGTTTLSACFFDVTGPWR